MVFNPCIQRPRISPCYGIVRSGGTLPGLMPGELYEAGNVSYGIPYSGPVTTALSTPCPPPTPSPHLVSCFAPHTLLHPTSNSALLPLSLCPSRREVPVQRHEYEYEYEQDPAHLMHGS